jgi:DNA-binding transcriptional LysR family regulator
MLDFLETFFVLSEQGTMLRAATYLRVSQSTISKRIQALEQQLGQKLIQRAGRNVELTEKGRQIAQSSKEIYVQLKNMLHQEVATGRKEISISISSGIIMSWGPAILKEIEDRLKTVHFSIGTYSATASIERVRSGEHMIALCHGTGVSAPDLSAEHIFDEKMVIVPSRLQIDKINTVRSIKIIGPEIHSESWSALSLQLDKAEKRWGFKLEIERSLVSFGGICRLAMAGFGHGLVPLTIAESFGITPDKIFSFTNPSLKLPVNILARKSSLDNTIVQDVIKILRKATSKINGQRH